MRPGILDVQALPRLGDAAGDPFAHGDPDLQRLGSLLLRNLRAQHSAVWVDEIQRRAVGVQHLACLDRHRLEHLVQNVLRRHVVGQVDRLQELLEFLGDVRQHIDELRVGEARHVLFEIPLAVQPLERRHEMAGVGHRAGRERGDASVFQREDAVRDVQDAVVVRDQQDGAAVLLRQLVEYVHDLAPRLLVQSRGRLVRQDDFRFVDQSPRDCDPLLLPARHLAGKVVHAVPQPHLLEQLDAALPRLAPTDGGVDVEGHLDVLARGERVEQVVGLEDESDVAAHLHHRLRAGAAQLLVQNAEAAVLHRAQGADQSQEGRFSRTGGPRADDDLAREYLRRDVEQDLLPELPLAEVVIQVADRDQWFHMETRLRTPRPDPPSGACAWPGLRRPGTSARS